MTLFRTAAAILLLTSTAAFAQATAPSTPAVSAPVAAPATTVAPAAAHPAGADLTKDGKPRMKIVRAQCQDEVKRESLKGDARKQAMAACIVKARPDMEARVKCQMDPSLKGLAKDARHAAVKACVDKTRT